MDSQTTVADARTAFARWNLSPAEFLRRLNRSCEQYMKSDVFTDIFSVVEFASSSGYISSPRCFGRILGVQDADVNKPVVSQFAQWLPMGIGRQDPSAMTVDALIDMGTHYVTQADIVTAGTLRVKITSASDIGKVIRFNGKDGDNAEVLDGSGNVGSNLTAANPSADTTQVFSNVEGIQAPVMVGRWTLWVVNGSTETQIGTYEPGETRPRYHRYMTRVTSTAIRAYCQRRHVEMTADTDWVWPDNINALEHGFNALSYRDKGNFKTEEECWEQGRKVLKDEFSRLITPIATMMTSDGFGGPNPINSQFVR